MGFELQLEVLISLFFLKFFWGRVMNRLIDDTCAWLINAWHRFPGEHLNFDWLQPTWNYHTWQLNKLSSNLHWRNFFFATYFYFAGVGQFGNIDDKGYSSGTGGTSNGASNPYANYHMQREARTTILGFSSFRSGNLWIGCIWGVLIGFPLDELFDSWRSPTVWVFIALSEVKKNLWLI